MKRTLGDVVMDVLFIGLALMSGETRWSVWRARLLVGLLSLAGLVLLGAPPERAIIVGAGFVILGTIGVGWQIISSAAVGLFVSAIAAWAVGWHLPHL